MRFNSTLPIAAVVLLLAAFCKPAAGQTYLDPGAEQLLAKARAYRNVADSSILSYTATVRTRIAAGLRMPLKDRTLFRHESASRVRWSRDGDDVVQVLALREQTPEGVYTPRFSSGSGMDDMFDPTQDRIYFGMTMKGDSARKDDDDVWIEHPLAAGSEEHYQYRSGDTITIRLQDGRQVRAIELQVLPRVASGHLVTGGLWIDASNGTVVQAIYRLSKALDIETEVLDEDDREDFGKIPGMFRPMEFDMSLVVMEYGLFDGRFWMPRLTRIEGEMRAGILRTPAAYEVSYDIEEVIGSTPEMAATEKARVDSTVAAWTPAATHGLLPHQHGKRRVQMILPFDTVGLLTAPDLPEPIWKQSAQFATDQEIGEWAERLDDLMPGASAESMKPKVTWGYDAMDLLRYNRVEALSVGVRAESMLDFGTRVSATARLGAADLHPNLVLNGVRANSSRTLSLRVGHELTAMDPQIDPFGMGNSASAVLLGRDDGEYYRATGVALTIGAPENKRSSRTFTLFAQQDRPADRETNISLRSVWDNGFRFRPNIAAASTELAGATLLWQPWWGTDPLGAQLGLDVMLEGAGGGYEFGRARATLRTALPIAHKVRAGIELGAGSSEGTVPVQRYFFVGGAATLRGYDGSAMFGTSFARARLELARTTGAIGVTLFSDAAWAGDRELFDSDAVLYSAGAGMTVLDGFLRFDLARALRSPTAWRLELYVDAIL